MAPRYRAYLRFRLGARRPFTLLFQKLGVVFLQPGDNRTLQFISGPDCQFRRLGHDNHRRLSKLYAWEEKKSKTSWGAQTVNYEKRVSGFVLANPELKFVCALVSDLCCPGYNPRQSLEKNSNLARTSARYKVDSSKIAIAARVELAKVTNKVKDESQEAKKPTASTVQQPKRVTRQGPK